mgnify:CR=1 FL=1
MHDIFFFTDLHGNYSLFRAMVNWCYEQDPDCTIVYGGDAADRGEDGYRIMQELLEDPHVIYLYGNHEDLFIKAADAIIAEYDEHIARPCFTRQAEIILQHMCDLYDHDVRLHLYNGGQSTLVSWLCSDNRKEMVERIRTLPRTFTYNNMDFCHAGGTYSAFRAVADAEYLQTELPGYGVHRIIWDRDNLLTPWPDNRVCIHGHTPVINLPTSIYGRDDSLERIKPCAWNPRNGGWKIDMDTAAVWSNRAYVLNCNTFTAYGFEKDHKSDEEPIHFDIQTHTP